MSNEKYDILCFHEKVAQFLFSKNCDLCMYYLACRTDGKMSPGFGRFQNDQSRHLANGRQ